jgi:rhodanese-related sulfurtransferase
MGETIFDSDRVRQHMRRVLSVGDKYYDCDEIRDYLREGGQLVDVRTPEEFAQGSLPGAINMPLQYLTLSCNSLSREKPVLIYCGTSKCSGIAKNVLDCVGFEKVINIGSYLQFRDCAQDAASLNSLPA